MVGSFSTPWLQDRSRHERSADDAVRIGRLLAATGGPDLSRSIFPIIATVDVDGVRIWPDDAVRPLVESLVGARMQHPDGPTAPLPRV